MKKYNSELAEKTLAAYDTSTDYDLLHALAKQGYRIPCFLWDNMHSEDTIFFRLAVCFQSGNYVEICECGKCFLDDMDGLEHFKKWCKRLQVKFITPHIQEQSK